MVFELLKYGHLHPTRGQDLADRLGMPLRALQSQIMDERIDGHPICASDSGLVGYYLPDSPEELEEYNTRLHKGISRRFKAYRALKKTLDRMRAEQMQKSA